MIRPSFVICTFLASLILVVFSVPFLYAEDGCQDGLPARLAVGEVGVVLPGSPVIVRAQPDRSSTQVGVIQAGNTFEVLEGPICEGEYTWWRVAFGTRATQGWALESNADSYFVMPLAGSLAHYAGIAFDLPAEVAATAIGETVQITTLESIRFTLEDYADDDPDETYPAALEIYPIKAFEGDTTMLGPVGQWTIDSLQVILRERPDLYATFDIIDNRLPDFAPNVAQQMLAHMAYLDFQNGSGYRFITYYGQDWGSPSNARLLYRYVGLTDDGEFFVSVDFPIDAAQLPPLFDWEQAVDDEDGGFGAWRQYTRDTAVFFDALAPDTFTPDLTQLDALISTLFVSEE